MTKSKNVLSTEVASTLKAKKTKEPKTIKVKTLFDIALVVVAVGLAYFAGSFMQHINDDNYKADVRHEAVQLITSLKSHQ